MLSHKTLLAAALGLLIAGEAAALTITDPYHGADAHGWGDVIGDPALFDIHAMDVDRNGSLLTVRVHTNFAGRAEDRLFAGYTQTAAGEGKGIGYGDLFLAAGWSPDASAAHYLTDDHRSGQRWAYGFALDDRWMSGPAGTGTLYRLGGASNDADALLSEDFLSGAVYRSGQEVAVDTASATVEALGAGTWSVDAAARFVEFQIDLAGTGLLGTDLGLHWGLTCGNDVIEGLAPFGFVPPNEVPAPGALWLTALGLLGLGRLRRLG